MWLRSWDMDRVLPSSRFLLAVLLYATICFLAASLPLGFAAVLMPWSSWSTSESIAGDAQLGLEVGCFGIEVYTSSANKFISIEDRPGLKG